MVVGFMVDGIDPEFFIPKPIGQNGGEDLSSSVLEETNMLCWDGGEGHGDVSHQ